MTLRQQFVQDHIDKTTTKLGLTADQSFLVFAHSLFTDRSIHSFDQNDNVDVRTVRKETFEQFINVGAGRQFSVLKAHQHKAPNRYV